MGSDNAATMEIYSYPQDGPGPQAGWTTESVTLPNGGTADVHVYLGLGPRLRSRFQQVPMGQVPHAVDGAGRLLNGIPTPTLTDDDGA